MIYLLIFFTSLVMTIILTPHLITFLKKSKIIDYPGAGKIHTEEIPKMGGIIIFFIVLIMVNGFIEDFESIKLLLVSVTILVFAGIVDDVLGLNSFIKFIIHNITAVLLILYLQQFYTEISLFGYTFEHPYDYLILILFIVGSINSINFLDGLDGLASGYSILIFSTLLALAIKADNLLLILLTVSLLGSTIGFLRFNAFPASLFLGDTGALVLGFFLISIAFLTSINFNDAVLDLTFPLFLLAVPLIDTFKVFILRIVKKKNPLLKDTDHQHHILKKSIISHELTVFIIELFSVLFIVPAVLYLFDYKFESTILFLVLGLIFVGLHPLLLKFKIAKSLSALHLLLHDYPIKRIHLIIKLLLITAFILLLFIAVLTFSLTTSLQHDELLLLLIMILGLFGLSVFQVKKLGYVNELYVFLNFTVFFIITKLSLPVVTRESLILSKIINQVNLDEIGFYFVSTVLAITLLLRWKALMTRKLFFTNTDLTMIILMLLTFVINSFLKFDLHYFLSISLLEGYIFYIWYKLVVDLNKNLIFITTILSFMLPISLLVTLLILTNG